MVMVAQGCDRVRVEDGGGSKCNAMDALRCDMRLGWVKAKKLGPPARNTQAAGTHTQEEQHHTHSLSQGRRRTGGVGRQVCM